MTKWCHPGVLWVVGIQEPKHEHMLRQTPGNPPWTTSFKWVGVTRITSTYPTLRGAHHWFYPEILSGFILWMLSPTPLKRHGLSAVATSPQRHGAGCGCTRRLSPSPLRLGMSSWLGAAAMVVRLGGLGASSWPGEVEFCDTYVTYELLYPPVSPINFNGGKKRGLWKLCNK